jgi:hypothetical protein
MMFEEEGYGDGYAGRPLVMNTNLQVLPRSLAAAFYLIRDLRPSQRTRA